MTKVVAFDELPPDYPTHFHAPAFWEALGRAVATFGFLEEALGKAILAFTGMKEIPEEEIDAARAAWTSKLERALTGTLGTLIRLYGNAVRDHGHATITTLDGLLAELTDALQVRNALCHGSWNQKPDAEGRSVPFFVYQGSLKKFETPVDVAYLQKVQRDTIRLACVVISTVTHMGWQFPGSSEPGRVVVPSKDRNAGQSSKRCGISNGCLSLAGGSSQRRTQPYG
jgi:hypothetical protein